MCLEILTMKILIPVTLSRVKNTMNLLIGFNFMRYLTVDRVCSFLFFATIKFLVINYSGTSIPLVEVGMAVLIVVVFYLSC